MLDNKKLEIIKKTVERYTREGIVEKGLRGKFVDFFLKNSSDSFNVAKLLMNVSKDDKLKKDLGFPNFNGFLWVINSSYYSMFYATRGLLEKEGIKIKADESVHLVTLYALIYYFYSNKKIEMGLVEEFRKAGEESAEILGKDKARRIIEDYANEKEKRSSFTYEIGQIAMENKAQTSLDRARKFNEEIRKLIGR